MAEHTPTTLARVREQILHLSLPVVARRARIEVERLARLEAGEEQPALWELDVLAELYGFDAELLGDRRGRVDPRDGVAALASQEEFRELSDDVKLRAIRAASAARELRDLRFRADGANLFARFAAEVGPTLKPVPRVRAAWQEGQSLASGLRKRLGLDVEPIPSVRDLVAEVFPTLAVLYAELGADGPAGLSFVDVRRGPAVVLNVEGKNRNPCVRRFSLAHELAHMIVDWNRQQPLATLSGFLSERGLRREQRANGFAFYFLCPDLVLRREVEEHGAQAACGRLMVRYGLHYSAIRLAIRNLKLGDLPGQPGPSDVPAVSAAWEAAERPAGIDGFPIDAPLERRTHVAQAAAHLYSTGRLPRDAFARALGVDSTVDVERVLDWFALDLPQEEEEAV